MGAAAIELSTLRKALAQLREAIEFWRGLAPDSALKPHLRSSVIQSFEFTYEANANQVATGAIRFAEDAGALLSALEAGLAN